MANTNLHLARKSKNDEFYTQYKDIEKNSLITTYLIELFIYLATTTASQTSGNSLKNILSA